MVDYRVNIILDTIYKKQGIQAFEGSILKLDKVMKQISSRTRIPLAQLGSSLDKAGMGFEFVNRKLRFYDMITTKTIGSAKKQDVVTRRLTDATRKFKFEYLGVMFAGQQLSKFMGEFTSQAVEWSGIAETFTLALNTVAWEGLEPNLDMMYGFVDIIWNLDDATKQTLGTLMFFSQAFGSVLSVVGSLVLALSSLAMAFPSMRPLLGGAVGGLLGFMAGDVMGGIISKMPGGEALSPIFKLLGGFGGAAAGAVALGGTETASAVTNILGKLKITEGDFDEGKFQATLWDNGSKKFGKAFLGLAGSTIIWGAGAAVIEGMFGDKDKFLESLSTSGKNVLAAAFFAGTLPTSMSNKVAFALTAGAVLDMMDQGVNLFNVGLFAAGGLLFYKQGKIYIQLIGVLESVVSSIATTGGTAVSAAGGALYGGMSVGTSTLMNMFPGLRDMANQYSSFGETFNQPPIHVQINSSSNVDTNSLVRKVGETYVIDLDSTIRGY